MKRLDEHGLRENTIVIFTSDNGATHPSRDKKFHVSGVDGPWKAIRQGAAKKKPGKWELYNLEKDPSETKNLAKKYPEILTRLAKISATDRSPNPRAKFPIYDKKK